MTQEKLIERARKWGDREDACFCSECLCNFARAELQKAAEIAEKYGEAAIGGQIRKLME
jgi:hypothetical protein